MKKVQYFRQKSSNLTRYSLGKTGKGRLHAVGKKSQYLIKMSNFRDNFNKKLTHKIIQRCITNNVSKIIMEDLSGIAGDNKFMKDWPYFDLQTKIENKAKEFNIEVIYHPAANTSRRCPNCGHIHADNRQQQENFECVECHYKNNADVVGGLNLINLHSNIVLPNNVAYF